MIWIWLLAGAAFVGACLWLWFDPGWESGLAVVTTLGALLSLFIRGRSSGSKSVEQSVEGAGAQAIHAEGAHSSVESQTNRSTHGPAIQGQSLVLSGQVTQVAGNQTIVHQGLDRATVRDICVAVFHENFQVMRGDALAIATERGERFTDNFVEKLASESPESLAETSNPDFQHSLFEAQKGFARSGDENLGELLLNLLVDRSKQPERNLMQLVLNEAIETAPKLTEGSLATLSLLFLFKYTVNNGARHQNGFWTYLDREVKPLIPQLAASETALQYLEYNGCGNVGLGGINSRTLESLILYSYHGLFSKGIEPEQLSTVRRKLSHNYDSYFSTCINDQSRLQMGQLNEETLESIFKRDSVPDDDQNLLRKLFQENLMSEVEARDLIVLSRPYMADLFARWNDSSMRTFTLTSVGIAIGQSNLRRLTEHSSDLSIWVN